MRLGGQLREDLLLTVLDRQLNGDDACLDDPVDEVDEETAKETLLPETTFHTITLTLQQVSKQESAIFFGVFRREQFCEVFLLNLGCRTLNETQLVVYLFWSQFLRRSQWSVCRDRGEQLRNRLGICRASFVQS